jgi:hypothetical protein
MRYLPALLTLLLSTACDPDSGRSSSENHFDVVIYGGTSAAMTAAVQLRRMDRSVAIVSPDTHLGGLTAGGLGYTDSGDKTVIGGLARDFYRRVYNHYQDSTNWNWQARSAFGNRGQGTVAIDGESGTMWLFEPSVAEGIFEDWVKEFDIPVYRDAWLDRENGVDLEDGRIVAVTTTDGATYRGDIFIDATYEGDLMAAAGVDYHVGREGNAVYGETWNGVQTGVFHHGHHFGDMQIDPYVIPGDSTSGLLPRISDRPPGEYGTGDERVQAYCFRTCLTKVAANRVPFPRPANYDPAEYELLLRVYDAGWRETFRKFDEIPNGKTDVNNHGPFSFDNIGMNYDYPEASYERRQEIIREHRDYQQGLLYFIANDERVPEEVRSEMSQWGLSRDEFTDNGNWPHQIYVREARRMIGDYVMTEADIQDERPTPESIGMGSYTIDSHNTQRYVTPEGYVQNEGDIGVHGMPPYEIALGTILPRAGQCENLLVPVAVSASHAAFGSIRMEPVFMILGQSAATLAGLALEANEPVHDIPYPDLRERLLADKQVLTRAAALGER